MFLILSFVMLVSMWFVPHYNTPRMGNGTEYAVGEWIKTSRECEIFSRKRAGGGQKGKEGKKKTALKAVFS